MHESCQGTGLAGITKIAGGYYWIYPHQSTAKAYNNIVKTLSSKSMKSRDNYDNEKRLPTVFYDLLEPIFQRLSKNDLLNRCLHGMTQNQNESVNGLLWGRCLKTKFCGSQKVELAVSETVCEFNTGSDVNIRADFVGSFSACYQVRPCGRFSNLRFGATLTF